MMVREGEINESTGRERRRKRRRRVRRDISMLKAEKSSHADRQMTECHRLQLGGLK